MATNAEWALITERAEREGMEVSRYVVHACTRAETVPTTLVRRMVREVVLLSKLEQSRWEDLGATGRWRALADAVDDWLEGEERMAQLTESGVTARWEALGSVPESGPPAGAVKTARGRS